MNAEWLNQAQEEVANAVEGVFALDVNNKAQLRSTLFGSLEALAGARIRSVSGPTAWNHAASDNAGTLVLVKGGASNQIYQSVDGGQTFTTRSMGSGTNILNRVCYGVSASKFVAVGANGEIEISPDGQTWTHRPAAGGFSGGFRDICYSESLSRACAVGDDAEIETADAPFTTWTKRSAPGASAPNVFQSVARNDRLGLFVAVGGTYPATFYSSPDGITWTARTSPTTFGDWYKLAATPYGFVALSGGTNDWAYSYDGITWTKRTDWFALGTLGLQEVCPRSGWIAYFDTVGWWIAPAPSVRPKLMFANATPGQIFMTNFAWVALGSAGTYVGQVPF